MLALTNLYLCFFNLLPLPPLDGSHVLKNLIGMPDETYWNLCRYGFILVIIAIQFPFVMGIVRQATMTTYILMAKIYAIA